MILVGTRLDVRSDAESSGRFDSTKFVSDEEAQELTKTIGAVAYVPCSAMTQERLKEVFDTAIRAALATKEKPRSNQACCVVL